MYYSAYIVQNTRINQSNAKFEDWVKYWGLENVVVLADWKRKMAQLAGVDVVMADRNCIIVVNGM